MFATLDLFVFTMGLTEGWESIVDQTMFAVAPGTVAGTFEPNRYVLRNLRHSEVKADMLAFWSLLRAVNPNARMLLTVSPVPLAATATSQHVLVASIYSKSVLRAVAGELAEDVDGIFYFPSYEIVSSHPSRGMFFEADLRNVSMFGVNFVMQHFFSGPLADEFSQNDNNRFGDEEFDLVCDEARLDVSTRLDKI